MDIPKPPEDLGPTGYIHRGHVTRWFRCTCGEVFPSRVDSVRSGNTRSCGCYSAALREARSLRHGHNRKGRRSPTYSTWSSMLKRCTNSACKDFPAYGGRGIRVCDRWKDFKNFLADMGEKPVGMSIDRVDNDGNYEPTNCRWTTPKEQANNTRAFRSVVINGEEVRLSEVPKRLGISLTAIYKRLRNGWDITQATTVGRTVWGKT